MAGKSNKSIGNTFEQQFCDLLALHKFWAHNMAQNKAGQPADVICSRNGQAYLIDCKVCTGKGFQLSRVEFNQASAMEKWASCGNGFGLFAIKFGEEIIMVSYWALRAEMNVGRKNLPYNDLLLMGMPFERWVKKCK